MVHFIYGRTGSGKSKYVYSLAEKSAEKRHAIILVPEREAVTAERDCAELSGTADIDVVTFSRLCNFIFRKKGGLCENYIGKGAKVKNCVIMQGAVISENADISYAIIDKQCVIKNGRVLAGHSTYPFVLAKNSIV